MTYCLLKKNMSSGNIKSYEKRHWLKKCMFMIKKPFCVTTILKLCNKSLMLLMLLKFLLVLINSSNFQLLIDHWAKWAQYQECICKAKWMCSCFFDVANNLFFPLIFCLSGFLHRPYWTSKSVLVLNSLSYLQKADKLWFTLPS